MPSTVVTLYHAPGCHLCDRARDVLAEGRAELGFELVEVDIAGDPELEMCYREWLPVVEIDGERAFVYYVDGCLDDGLQGIGTMGTSCYKPRYKELVWRIV